MNALTAVLIAVIASTSSMEYESGGVRLTVTINNQLYLYEIENVDAPPIMRFEVETRNTYNHKPPPEWEEEFTYGEGILHVWTDDPGQAIRRGRSKVVSTRVGSAGAVLGEVTASVGFGEGEEPVVFERVWGAVRFSAANLIMIPTTIVAIALFHALLIARSRRR